MSPSRKAPPSAVVGLDIGSESIKVAEAKYGKDGITITAIGIAPTPEGVIDNEVIVDPKGLGSAIKALLAESGIKTKQCVSAVSGQAKVVVRVIEVPKMEPKELDETMKWEVERHVPFSPSQVIMDFQPLETENPDPNAQNMEVLLAVAQDELINAHVETLQAAGLKPMAIDIEPLAVGRALISAGKNGANEGVVAVVNIGNQNTDMGIFEQGALAFPSPPLPYAGTTFTQEIAEVFGETPERAETLKKEYASVNLSGFASPAPDPNASFTVQEPTTMGGSDPDFAVAEEAEPEPAPEPMGFQVTTDGPVFDLGEPAAPAAEPEPVPGAPVFDMGGDAAPAGGPSFDLGGPAPAAGPVFDLGDTAGTPEPASDEASTFDLGSAPEVQDDDFKPDFDLEEDEHAPVRAQDADLGIAPVAAQSAYQPGSMEDRVFQAISNILVDLANEVRRSVEYYATRYNRSPEKVFLCGGTAKIPHLDEFLTQELGIKVEVADPVANLKVKIPSASDRYLHEMSPMLAVSIGLAIRDMVG